MATSGTDVLLFTAKKIVMQAMYKAGLLKYDAPNPPNSLVQPYLDTLNVLVKQWESMGLQLWKRARLRITPVAYRSTYKFGTLADNVQQLKFESQTIASAVSGATTLNIAAASGDMTSGDVIDIYLSDGSIHATTISGSPTIVSGGYQVTLAVALDAACDAGARIYVWKTSTSIPIMLRDAYSASTTMQDLQPITVEHYDDFQENTSPRAAGSDGICVALEKLLGYSILHIYPEPISVDRYILVDCAMPTEIFTSMDDNPDMPPGWYMAMIYELARIMMDDNPDKDYADAHRLNIIKGADRTLQAAKDMNWEPKRHRLQVDMSSYDNYY